MTVRVLLDATAVPPARGGVGRYVDELVSALVAEGADLVVACQTRDVDVLGGTGAEVVPVAGVAGRAARLAWEQAGLPGLVRRTGAQVLHSPHYTMPLAAPAPVVVTLHDATFFSNPEWHGQLKRRFFRQWTRVAARRAAGLVVPSAATRAAVREFVRVPEDRFTVAPHGVDTRTFSPVPEAERRRVAESLGVSGSYVAFLGTLEPRKNVPALVAGWVEAVRGLPEPPSLVLAGGAGWDPGVDAAVAAVPPGLDLRRAGYVPLGDLAGLLAGADVVAYPSLGEGFGLPVLEAMACGAAVLTTRRLSLPEVGGDAVAYCDVTAESIEAGLAALLADPARRQALRAAAVERASAFTWTASARLHLTAYERAARRA